MERTAQINWINQNVVAFIAQGGAGDYDVTIMEPAELAAFMVGTCIYEYEAADTLPEWWSAADHEYAIEQLTATFEAELAR